MVAMTYPEQTMKYLSLLSSKFPSQQAVFTEIINLQAILNLPKGTEHFMSDVHGEYEAFMHILNNCSGVIREHVDMIYGEGTTPDGGELLSEQERSDLCTLIYYPHEKLELQREARADSPTWYRAILDELITVARKLSSRYTRSKVRKAIPHDFAYIIDELLHTHPDENNYRVRYHERIVTSILETDAAEDFICSLSELIKHLAVDHIHLVGDVYDRGPGASKIMDRLLQCHSQRIDFQWGNHDVLWMGAAAGEPACIVSALRNNLRYNNFEILENDYGISLRELVAFADRTYKAGEKITPLIKAVNVLLFKLEGKIIQRHPEWDMEDRLLLSRMDLEKGTVRLDDGLDWPLMTCDFPTLDPQDPYALTRAEQHIVDRLVTEFLDSDHLKRHIDFLYAHGSMYLVRNNNLLFHGCVPLNEDGTFSAMRCDGVPRSGRDYLDFCDDVARRAWRLRGQDTDEARDALDWMWYLWIGFKSPTSGRLVKTFERSYIEDKSTWEEPMDPYFMQHRVGHIVNGHTPVKVRSGESPIRGGGKVLIIDGGFCSAYHPKTGIAGYTLIYSSRGMRLKAHEAFHSVEEALTRNQDIQSETNFFAPVDQRLMVGDTDTGDEIRAQINDLRQLLDAYRTGQLPEQAE